MVEMWIHPLDDFESLALRKLKIWKETLPGALLLDMKMLDFLTIFFLMHRYSPFPFFFTIYSFKVFLIKLF